ncbi:transposase [Streptomyces olivoreticuli]|uniref:transposase n=1 Tax=Streptomyces olivoreticuli TaxID=68246 RepID=UPI003CC7E6DD
MGQGGAGDLSDREWARLEPYLPRKVGRGGRWKSHRGVINGILFRQRTGVPWRGPPARFGIWKAVHDRHRRWSADGAWERVLRAVQADADAEGRIDWSMGPRAVPISTPRAPAPARRVPLDNAASLFSIVRTRPRAAPVAGSPARSTSPVRAADVRPRPSSHQASGATPRN